MKKSVIGSIVGGLIFFICQSLSWTVLNLHNSVQSYTPAQDTIMKVLNSTLTEGGYLLPSAPANTSSDEMMKRMQANLGKPWASIQYHKSFETDMNRMMSNMGLGLLTTIIMIWFVCWIVGKFANPNFGSVFLTCLFIGLCVYINVPHSEYLWYRIFDGHVYLLDAVIGWGLTGVWLGWWLPRKAKA